MYVRTVPRAVASALQAGPRSLPLAALIQRDFQYMQSQIDLRSGYSNFQGLR
jgi:hypothetical protein